MDVTTDRSQLESPTPEAHIVWVRRTHDWIAVVLALVALVIATALVANPPAEWEVSIFRSINDLPRQARWLLWPLQQAGMAMAVPVGAVMLWYIVKHWRPPVSLVAGGIVFGWAGAKLIKEFVDRGRPAAILDDVRFGFDTQISGLGYPSGHAVVAFTLAWVFAPYLSRPRRWSLYLLAVVVGFSRIYMGAHLPLDVVGGAAYGVLIGAVVNLVSGLREDRLAGYRATAG